MSKPIRLLIAEDDHLVRAGLRNLLANDTDLEVVGEAADGLEVIERALSARPDVILLDLVMPNQSGVEAITAIKQVNPSASILVLTGFADDDMVFAAIQAGAAGYLLKTTAIPDLIRAIHTIAAGETPLEPSIANKLIRRLTHPTPPPAKTEPFTKRERTILQLVARGLSNADIARTLSVSDTTVRTHMNRILRKLNMTSRTQAALYALKTGLANLDSDPDLNKKP
jgi:NarL family two-component system response regulator LiaR